MNSLTTGLSSRSSLLVHLAVHLASSSVARFINRRTALHHLVTGCQPLNAAVRPVELRTFSPAVRPPLIGRCRLLLLHLLKCLFVLQCHAIDLRSDALIKIQKLSHTTIDAHGFALKGWPHEKERRERRTN